VAHWHAAIVLAQEGAQPQRLQVAKQNLQCFPAPTPQITSLWPVFQVYPRITGRENHFAGNQAKTSPPLKWDAGLLRSTHRRSTPSTGFGRWPRFAPVMTNWRGDSTMSGARTTSPQFDIVATARRRWSREQKRAIVEEIDAMGTPVSEVARRHGSSLLSSISILAGLRRTPPCRAGRAPLPYSRRRFCGHLDGGEC
jgi:hypothetical protein